MKKILDHPISENSDCTLWKTSLWTPWVVLLRSAHHLDSLLLAIPLIMRNLVVPGCLSTSCPEHMLFSKCSSYHPQLLVCCIPHSPANITCKEGPYWILVRLKLHRSVNLWWILSLHADNFNSRQEIELHLDVLILSIVSDELTEFISLTPKNWLQTFLWRSHLTIGVARDSLLAQIVQTLD
jgi:hypothetical protein